MIWALSTQGSKTKPEGEAVSVKHDRDLVRRSCYERVPERFPRAPSGRLCGLISEESVSQSGRKPRKQDEHGQTHASRMHGQEFQVEEEKGHSGVLS